MVEGERQFITPLVIFHKKCRVGRSELGFLFAIFKIEPIAADPVYFYESNYKKSSNFHFQKITGTLKCIFLHLQIPSFSKEQLAKSKSEIKNCTLFYA